MRSHRQPTRTRRYLAPAAVFGLALCMTPVCAMAADAGRTVSNAELLERIDALEKELKSLRKDTRVLEVSDEERKKERPTAGYRDGFFVDSKDGKYKLKVGGYVQADSRWALDEADNPTVDAFTIRRARLDIRGTVAEWFDFRIMPDFAGSSLVLQDAYVDHKFAPWAVLRAGKFKSPVGLDRLQSGSSMTFIERSLVDNLIPNRDLGLQLYGDFRQGEIGYQLAVLNGVVDGGSTDTDVNDAVDVAARVFAHPFRNTSVVPLQGLGVGIAGTYGQEQGTAASPQLPQFRTSSRNSYFRYSADSPATAAGTTVADGTHWRVTPQGYYYWGPFGSLFEYGISSQDLRKGAATATTRNDAWQVRASYVLTGEANTYKGVSPENPFNFGGGGWGAWEMALRYANLDIDGETFTKGFADNTRSVSEIDSITAGVNWWLNRNILWQLNYEHSEFAKGKVIAPPSDDKDRDSEDLFLTRIQLLF
jgi:phosphate-selective porin OprO/OprP